MNNILLFVLCSLVWGSTWYVITLQLGCVDPVWSVSYRFFLAALFLGICCKLKGLPMKLSWQNHGRLLFQGTCLCGLPYWLVYESEQFISSALTAIITTSILYFNVIIRRVWLGNPVRPMVVAGGLMGSLGIFFIFWPEVRALDHASLKGSVMALVASLIMSVGCVSSENNQKAGVGLWQATTWNMFYGAAFLLVVALIMGVTAGLELNCRYLLSLCYLSVFGSVIALSSYLALISRLGADKAAYVDIVYPVVALGVSTLLEGFQWSYMSGLGVMIILAGNLVAMGALEKLYRGFISRKAVE